MSDDLPVWMIYPSNASGGIGEQVNYAYLPQMLLDTVSTSTSTYVYNTDYDAAGRVTLRELGASSLIDNHYAYFDWTAVNGQGRLSTIISHTSTPDLQNLSYTYDANGNVLTIQDYLDKTGNNPQTQTFTYDALDRLTSAKAENGTNGIYPLEYYTYNSSTGNLESKAGVSYTYGDANHDHAVTMMGSNSYSYDANGNQVTRTVGYLSSMLSYDAENRLVGVSGATSATFVYDGDGNRVKATIGGTTTAYVGNYFEWTGSTNTMKKYYYAGNTRVVMRTGTSTLNYLLGDHLGSTAITTNSSGVRSGEVRYMPWGTERYNYGTTPTTFKYTGQRQESTLGLYFYNARWYDASAGRFLNGDSIVPNNGQGNDDSKRIQILLVVDYHEPNLLKHLGEMHSDYLHKISDDPQSAREADRLNPNPIQNDDQEQDLMEVDNSNNIYQPLVDFNQQSNLGRQQNNVSQDEDGKNNANNLVDMMPTRLNSMVLDRYAYTSNCPTKYTDPSGHCDLLHTMIGVGMIFAGGIFIRAAVAGILISIPLTPVDPIHAMELAGLSGLIGGVGGIALVYGGVSTLIKDDCIPDFLNG